MARKPQRPQRRPQGRNNSGPAAAARRKAATDRGLTADKVPGSTPPPRRSAPTRKPPAPAARGNRASPSREGARRSGGLAADPSGTDRGRYRMQDRMVWPAIVIAVLVVLAIIVAVLFVWG